MVNAASCNELKLLDGWGSFCQGWRIRGRLNCFQILSFHPFFKQKSQSFKSVTAFIAVNSVSIYGFIRKQFK